ncbi:hypothetical protein [Hydrogenophaga sp. T2]|uniref:hypothetical protein n=1 Tax=Hydrogenophaga sp. T2 TaxID=3132823 RepID=UPI003CED9BF5
MTHLRTDADACNLLGAEHRAAGRGRGGARQRQGADRRLDLVALRDAPQARKDQLMGVTAG